MWIYYLVFLNIREKLTNIHVMVFFFFLLENFEKLDRYKQVFFTLRSLNQDLDFVIRVRVFIFLYFSLNLSTNPIEDVPFGLYIGAT